MTNVPATSDIPDPPYFPDAVVLISALPPSRSRAGLTALNMIKTLSQEMMVVCVVDDTGPAPTPVHGADVDNVTFMRIRDFRRGDHPYSQTPRIFILDEGFDSLFVFELFLKIGGAVIPVSASMHQSIKALMEEQTCWPNNYAAFLNKDHGKITALKDKGLSLMGALMDFKRDAKALASEIPALDCLKQANAILALSDYADSHLKACGLNTQRLILPTIGAGYKNTQKYARAQLGITDKNLFVIAISTNADQDRVERALKIANGIQKPTLVINIMASVCPFISILASDCSIVLGANDGAVISTFAETAIHAEIPTITIPLPLILEETQRLNNIDYPALYIDHKDAVHSLALKIVEVETALREKEKDVPADSGITAPCDTGEGFEGGIPIHDLVPMLSKFDYAPYPPKADHPGEIYPKNIETDAAVIPRDYHGTALFIGAAPGAMLLASLMPQIDSLNAAKFLSDDTATSLGRILALPKEMAAARLGFETPILPIETPDHPHHWSYEKLVHELQKTDHVFACHPQAVTNNLQTRISFIGLKHQLIFTVDHSLSENERWNFSKSQGLAWRLDHHRRSIHVVLLTGGHDIKFNWASVTEENMKTTVSVANEYDTRMLSGSSVKLRSHPSGVIEFRITISGNLETGPLTAEEALNYIRKNPIMLEWGDISLFPEGEHEQSGWNDSDSRNQREIKPMGIKAGPTPDNTKADKDTTMTDPVHTTPDSDSMLSISDVNQTLKQPLKPDGRLTNAAIQYTDTLLEAQRQQFESFIAELQAKHPPMSPALTLSATTALFAEGDNFMGAGWSALAQSPDGTHYRWMQRIASILITIEPDTATKIEINGFGIARGRFLKHLNLYLGNEKINGKLTRTGLRSWQFTGIIPAIRQADMHSQYQILRFENKSASCLKKDRDYRELSQPVPSKSHKELMLGEDGGHVFASLGITSIHFSKEA